MYQIAYVTLKLPFGALDDLVTEELEWMLEGHYEEQKSYFTTIAYAVREGYVSANNGKPIKLFDDKNGASNGATAITEEDKKQELEALNAIFE